MYNEIGKTKPEVASLMQRPLSKTHTEQRKQALEDPEWKCAAGGGGGAGTESPSLQGQERLKVSKERTRTGTTNQGHRPRRYSGCCCGHSRRSSTTTFLSLMVVPDIWAANMDWLYQTGKLSSTRQPWAEPGGLAPRPACSRMVCGGRSPAPTLCKDVRAPHPV